MNKTFASGLLSAILLACSAATAQAWLISDDQDADKPYYDIKKVAIAETPTRFSISMELYGDPTLSSLPGGTTYSIFFGSNAGDLFNNSDYSVDGLTTKSRGAVNFAFNGTSWVTNSPVQLAGSSVTANTLTWTIDKTGLPHLSATFYFAGQTSTSADGFVYDQTGPVTAVSTAAAPVPIPPALLLFGSGLAGMGLFRRKGKSISKG